MLGSIGIWFYEYLLGITSGSDCQLTSTGPFCTGPAYENVVIQPHMVTNLTSAAGYIKSIRGRIFISSSTTAYGKQTFPQSGSRQLTVMVALNQLL
jgi:hypothetical protein